MAWFAVRDVTSVVLLYHLGENPEKESEKR